MFKRAIKIQKVNGPDEVSTGLIEIGTGKFFSLKTRLFLKCVNKEEAPGKYKIGYKILIYKKGDRQI